MTDPAARDTLDPWLRTIARTAAARRDDRSHARLLAHRRPQLTAVVVAAVTLSVAVAAIGAWPVGVFQDDGIYTILAKSLASGEGYRYLNLPGAPHATHYPPAYPAFLALLWTLSPRFPANVAAFTFANAALLALAAVGVHHFGRVRVGLSNERAAIVTLMTVACIPALTFGVFVLSEPMFMALLFPTLFLAERAGESGSRRDALLTGAAAGALAMVRTTGVFVLPALAIVLLVRRRWTAALLAVAGGALFLVPWQLWVNSHGGEIPAVLVGKYGPYSTWLTGAFQNDGLRFASGVVAKNLRELEGLTWKMFAGVEPGGAPPHAIIRSVIAIGVLALLGVGVARVRRRTPVALLFLAAYLMLVLIWPFEPTRFVWVVLPLFGILIAAAIGAVVDWRPTPRLGRLARITLLTVVTLLAVGYVMYNVRGVRERWWETVARENAKRATPLVEWARSATKPGDVLATDDDALLHLYTGRRTIPVGTFTPQEYLQAQTYSFATEQLRRLVHQYRPRYVLCSTSYGVMAARGLLRGDGPRLRVVAILARGVVFERMEE